MKWRTPLARPYYDGVIHDHSSFPPFVPEQPHLGSFGAVRKHDIHTGVDLYCRENDRVLAMEPGVIVDIVDFTGSKVLDKEGKPMDWWNDTKAVLVKGASGVIVYGEIIPYMVQVGQKLAVGAALGTVTPVLPDDKLRPDIPHHSTSMLHIELYTTEKAEKDFRWGAWNVGDPQPEGLLDPTSKLKEIF